MTAQPSANYTPPPHAARVTQSEIAAGLARAGMRPGDTVLVHSSLSRFGHVEGGANAVIDALLQALGPEGTLIMSAITTTSPMVASCIEAEPRVSSFCFAKRK